MIRARFNPEDVRATKLVDPGRHLAIVEDVREGITKETKAKKYTWRFKGLEGMAKDVPFSRIYTEEYIEFMVPLLQKGFGLVLDENEGSDVDLESLKGRKIWLIIKRGNYQGEDRNEIAGFEPYDDSQLTEASA